MICDGKNHICFASVAVVVDLTTLVHHRLFVISYSYC